jgi:CHAT domain-containing protein/Tfp pilus assembly protein PilF
VVPSYGHLINKIALVTVAILTCITSFETYCSSGHDAEKILARARSFDLPQQADSSLHYLNIAYTLFQQSGDRVGVLTSLGERAEIYNKTGRYTESLDDFEKLYQKAFEWFGTDNEWYMSGLTGMGKSLRQLGQYPKAVMYLTDALRLLTADTTSSITALVGIYHELGDSYSQLSEYETALEKFEKALSLQLSASDDTGPDIARTFESIGSLYRNTGKLAKALDYNEKALRIREEHLPPTHPDLSSSYLNLGVVHFELGNYAGSVHYYDKSLAIGLEHYGPDHPDLARIYNNLANSYNRLGKDDESIRFHRKAIEIRINTLGENHMLVAGSYNNMADVYRQKRDYELALQYFKRAVAIARSVLGVDHPLTGALLNNLGLTYEEMEDYDEALGYYKDAVNISLHTLDEMHPNIAVFYNNIGNVYRRLGKYNESLEYHQRTLKIRENVFPSNHPDIAQSFYNFGMIYQHIADYDRALEYMHRSLEIRKEVLGLHNQITAATYYDIGLIYSDMGDYYSSLRNYQFAIQCLSPVFSDSSYFSNPTIDDTIYDARLVDMLISKSESFRRLYTLDGNPKYLNSSFETISLASDLIDKVRHGYGSDRSKLLLAQRSNQLYDYAIKISLALHELTGDSSFLHEAFLFAEKARASVLWESVIHVHALEYAGIPDSLLVIEQNLRSELNFYELQLHRTDDSDPFADQYRKTFLALRSKYDILMQKLKSENPDFYELRYRISSFGAEEVQSLLDQESAFIQYFLGEDEIYIFAITYNSCSVYRGDKTEEINDSARQLNRSLRRFDKEGYRISARNLFTSLVEPILPDIAGKESLIIIPDGILHYIPFDALLASDPEPAAPFSELDYVLRHYAITYHYSARLFSHNIKKTPEMETPYYFAGFAPVEFESGANEYILADTFPLDPPMLTRDDYLLPFDTNGSWFASLPYSRDEIEYIISLFDMYNLPASSFLKDQATVDNFKEHAQKYSIVHIASHAFVSERNPHLSGIVFVNHNIDSEAGISFLLSGELYSLQLNADLVVLSGCESGFGELIRGEGLMAMTRGFIYAGASNLVVSLWKVYDLYTKELMSRFYAHYLSGDTYSRALRNAKLHMIRNEDTAFPQFWSGFILIGKN